MPALTYCRSWMMGAPPNTRRRPRAAVAIPLPRQKTLSATTTPKTCQRMGGGRPANLSPPPGSSRFFPFSHMHDVMDDATDTFGPPSERHRAISFREKESV